MPVVHHPGFGGSVRYQPVTLSDDPDVQVAQTIDLMRQYAREDSQSSAIQLEALAAIGEYPGSPEEAVYRWVKRRVQFLNDEHTAQPLGVFEIPVVEVLIRPIDLAAMCSNGGCRRAGDCDDFSMYGAALLLALGRRVSFVTVAADAADPERFSHVYLASYGPNGERIPLDISHGPAPGWETQHYTRREEWPIDGNSDWLTLAAVAGAAYFLTRRIAA